jgi:hypothetical protein
MAASFVPIARGKWHAHPVVRFADGGGADVLPAEIQTVNDEEPLEHVHGPSMLLFAEDGAIRIAANRLDLSDMRYRTALYASDDRGATWSRSLLDIGYTAAMADLGGGRILLAASDGRKPKGEMNALHLSPDRGATWTGTFPLPPALPGKEFNFWGDAFLVEGERILAGGYVEPDGRFEDGARSMPGLRASLDGGRTWGGFRQVPEWIGHNEVQLFRADNGDLVAGLRRDYPREMAAYGNDNTGGLSVSRSTDGGATWSVPEILYDWGRHFPSMVSLPGGAIAMTHVVRMGYTERAADGLPRFGVEAVISRDGGRSWDLDHRCVLASWTGRTRSPLGWLYGCQSTSTARLADGSLLTVFSSGRRSQADPNAKANGAAYDVCLVHWAPDLSAPCEDRAVRDAPFDSDRRNVRTPVPEPGGWAEWSKHHRNVATVHHGARVEASECSNDPGRLLFDRASRRLVRFETVPAEASVLWPEPRAIDGVRIHAGCPFKRRDPETECVPLDYRIQALDAAGAWRDLVPPVEGAPRYAGSVHLHAKDAEFFYAHDFPPVRTHGIRVLMTRSSDTGLRRGYGETLVVPEGRRKIFLRLIEALEVRP